MEKLFGHTLDENGFLQVFVYNFYGECEIIKLILR
jgi:hypothetical protein